MQTYKKTFDAPRLEIRHDDAESPREWDNLGYFITSERRYMSPDGKKAEWVQSIVESTADDANNSEHHAELITAAINETGEIVKAIYPVYRYEHGNVLYRRGTASGFDYSNCGFYIVTDKTQNVLGTPDDLIEKCIDGELETYTSYVNGEVYYFTLYDDNGDIEDSCGGFYDIDDIKEALPDSFKNEDMHDYLKY